MTNGLRMLPSQNLNSTAVFQVASSILERRFANPSEPQSIFSQKISLKVPLNEIPRGLYLDYNVDVAGPPMTCFDVWGLTPSCKRLIPSRNRPDLLFLMSVCNFWRVLAGKGFVDQEDLQKTFSGILQAT
ncbi:hypothetical protein AVEN_131826-1 [Araneus ventricosus]|uniref:Uncharacterized protein n=1 Tax=Araneus ventricosus TaxID=182803 RepID=A0A4Y2H9K7_ARAVE|nr:hypothetical protein AVEN_131826-1 [Araneus ventricosus]